MLKAHETQFEEAQHIPIFYCKLCLYCHLKEAVISTNRPIWEFLQEFVWYFFVSLVETYNSILQWLLTESSMSPTTQKKILCLYGAEMVSRTQQQW